MKKFNIEDDTPDKGVSIADIGRNAKSVFTPKQVAPAKPKFKFDEESKDLAPAQLSEVEHLDDLVNKTRVDYSIELTPPEVALKVNGEIMGTLGNFSVIYGKAKSKKTFAVSLAIAGALGKIGAFEGCLPPNKSKVILFDTEQGEYHVLKVAKRIMTLLNKTGSIENFEVFQLRNIPTESRKKVVERVIQTTPNLGLVVIDGIKDLIKSINDEAEATGITDWLMQVSYTFKCHILTVLHKNKTDNNARGHIGTEILNKGETAITVEVEKDNKEVSKVAVSEGRWKHFEPFAFMINDIGLPEVIEGWKPKDETKGKNKGVDPLEVDDYIHHKILVAISENAEQHSNEELLERIQLAVSDKIEQIGRNKAQIFKRYYLDEGYIEHHGTPRSRTAYYTINVQNDTPEKGENP